MHLFRPLWFVSRFRFVGNRFGLFGKVFHEVCVVERWRGWCWRGSVLRCAGDVLVEVWRFDTSSVKDDVHVEVDGANSEGVRVVDLGVKRVDRAADDFAFVNERGSVVVLDMHGFA